MVAGVHGVDLDLLNGIIAEQPEGSQGRAQAEAELKIKKGIQAYLTIARQGVKQSGNISTIFVRRIPSQLLEAEERRMDVLLRSGHVSRYTYTNRDKPEMYWCCLPGCAGSVLNSTKVRQSFRPPL